MSIAIKYYRYNKEIDITNITIDDTLVILPLKFEPFLRNSMYEYKNLVLVTSTGFSLEDVLKFDAQMFVDEIVKLYGNRPFKGMIAFDCFSNLLVSYINTKLKIEYPDVYQGTAPSFLSVFLCNNKYYMRKLEETITSSLFTKVPFFTKENFLNDAPEGKKYVIKITDSQFYTGVLIGLEKSEVITKLAEYTREKETNLNTRKQF